MRNACKFWRRTTKVNKTKRCCVMLSCSSRAGPENYRPTWMHADAKSIFVNITNLPALACVVPTSTVSTYRTYVDLMIIDWPCTTSCMDRVDRPCMIIPRRLDRPTPDRLHAPSHVGIIDVTVRHRLQSVISDVVTRPLSFRQLRDCIRRDRTPHTHTRRSLSENEHSIRRHPTCGSRLLIEQRRQCMCCSDWEMKRSRFQ